MRRFVTSKPPENKEALEPLILDGISQILDNGQNIPRNFKTTPLNHDEQLFIIQTLHKELEDAQSPGGLIYLYGHILDYVSALIVYN